MNTESPEQSSDTTDYIEELRRQLHEASHQRALLTHAFLRQLTPVLGRETSIELLRQGAYQVGQGNAASFIAASGGSPLTPEQAIRIFQRIGPDRGRMFPIEYECQADGSCELLTLACPLKDAALAHGLDQRDFEALVLILDGVTHGALEGLGLSASTTLPRLDSPGCCRLRITPASVSSG
ncbi:hypothetical protein DNJ95_17300 [Stutzerimonas kirkiae]|uniref:Transcriptional regulator n=1 Tax=Stutzerimonas kirkiae TaxID=2211392 RepID=A0A4Q9QZW5_9GAMM|nr:hypothetical protein [Stutzerimonas kirkiae]TBU90068.1 hypothetical protein DNJ96_17065 [Stutzerimonas kirkiae]TBU99072.1 hypothetical protein DNJ95_17300 [Stutzerimonas kirkiae]TBV10193.1 hypothetical protein DNK01_18220 [Stutzerimonas kirkiae]